MPAKKTGIKHSNGYVFLDSPNHPLRYADNYVKRSRLIMEHHLGRYLSTEETVHHINEIKNDDRIENLQLFPNEIYHGHLKRKLFRTNIHKQCTMCLQTFPRANFSPQKHKNKSHEQYATRCKKCCALVLRVKAKLANIPQSLAQLTHLLHKQETQ